MEQDKTNKRALPKLSMFLHYISHLADTFVQTPYNSALHLWMKRQKYSIFRQWFSFWFGFSSGPFYSKYELKSQELSDSG